MISIAVHNPEGKTTGNTELPEAVFGVKINPALMAQAVRVYLSNQRHAVPRTKDRGEIDRTKAKWFRQKGTGRARHGSRSAAIFVGGYKAHGPAGTQNYKLKMSQKMRQAALKSALTSKLQDQQLILIDGLEKMAPKTKAARQVLTNLNLNVKKVTLVMPEKIEALIRAFRNLPNVSLEQVTDLNTYTTLNSGMLVFTKAAIQKLSAPVSGKADSAPAQTSVAKPATQPTTKAATTDKKPPKKPAAAAKPAVKKTADTKPAVKKAAAKAPAKSAAKK